MERIAIRWNLKSTPIRSLREKCSDLLSTYSYISNSFIPCIIIFEPGTRGPGDYECLGDVMFPPAPWPCLSISEFHSLKFYYICSLYHFYTHTHIVQLTNGVKTKELLQWHLVLKYTMYVNVYWTPKELNNIY